MSLVQGLLQGYIYLSPCLRNAGGEIESTSRPYKFNAHYRQTAGEPTCEVGIASAMLHREKFAAKE